jgi:membrane-associated phospholipid phosphatase
MLKKYKGETIFFYVFSAVMLIIAYFADLKIDIALNNPQNPFAIWFCNIGELPSRLLPILAGAVLFYFSDKKPIKCFGLFSLVAGSAYFGYHIERYFFIEENGFVFGIIFGLYFGAFVLFFGQFIKPDDKMKKQLVTLAIVGLAVMAVQTGIIEGTKYLWGRVRFRDLLAAGSYDAFTSWLHPNGINGNKSFPSGHTASAGMCYLLLILPYINEKCRQRKSLLFILAFAYTLNVGFTRLIMGAHYLSDITVGNLVSFTCVVIAMYVIDKKKYLVIE